MAASMSCVLQEHHAVWECAGRAAGSIADEGCAVQGEAPEQSNPWSFHTPTCQGNSSHMFLLILFRAIMVRFIDVASCRYPQISAAWLKPGLSKLDDLACIDSARAWQKHGLCSSVCPEV